MMKMMKMNAVAKEEAKATAAEAAEARRVEEARAEAKRKAEEAARKAAFEAEKARKAFEAVKVGAPKEVAPKTSVTFQINGVDHTISDAEYGPSMTLASYIREVALLTGTKVSCNEGGCGACIVTVVKFDGDNPRSLNSCLTPVLAINGWKITTVEGVGGRYNGYNPIQEKLCAEGGSQCGYCSPGMVMQLYSWLQEHPNATQLEIDNILDGNLCRCTGYRPILQAFRSFASDSPNRIKLPDIEDLKVCERTGKACSGGENSCGGTGHCHSAAAPGLHAEADFRWETPATVEELLTILQGLGTEVKYRIVDGNTGTGVFKHDGPYSVYINVNQISELHEAVIDGQEVVMGANTKITDAINLLKTSDNEVWQGVANHMLKIASYGIRNQGSLAGNLMMKNAHNDFPSDVFLSLETAGAVAEVLDVSGASMSMAIGELPYTDMNRKLFHKIRIPLGAKHSSARKTISNLWSSTAGGNAPKAGQEWKYRSFKIMPRSSNAHAYVNAGFMALVDTSDNFKIVEKPRIVFGGLNSTFVHASETEAFLMGRSMADHDMFLEALGILAGELNPEADPVLAAPLYRKQLAIGLFYKFYLYVLGDSASEAVRSGALDLDRGLSSGQQDFETDESQWPITEPVEKYEGKIQIAGEAEYVGDIPAVAGELNAAFVLTTVACADIVSVNCDAALAMAGVVAWVDANDIPGQNDWKFLTEAEPLFCTGRSEYAGMAVGLIVAKTREIAVAASKMVVIEYANMSPVITDVEEAMTKQELVAPAYPAPIGYGDVETALKGADTVIKGRFKMGSQYHFHMETHVCISKPTEDGFDIDVPTQGINACIGVVSKVMGIPVNSINMSVKRLGGAYGGKIDLPNAVASAATVAANKLRTPVRLWMTLEDNMNMFGKRNPYVFDYEIGFDADRKIVGVKSDIYSDAGCVFQSGDSWIACFYGQSTYNIPALTYNAWSVKTHCQAHTAVRAPGMCNGHAMFEHMMEHSAAELGVSPLELRMSNTMTENSPILCLPENLTLAALGETCKTEDIVAKLKESSDYDTRVAAATAYNAANTWKKRGITLLPIRYMHFLKGNGLKFHCLVSVFANDGSVSVTHGGIEMGQGVNTKVRQVVAAKLGIDISLVKVKASASITNPNGSTTGGSMGSEVSCAAALKACDLLNENLAPIKDQLGPDAAWFDIITAANLQNVDLCARYNHRADIDPALSIYHVWGACVTEVEVDVLTGEMRIVRSDLLEDAGLATSPQVDIGQVEGAFMMGIGLWTSEEIKFHPDTGKLLTENTWEYKPPAAKDLPQDFRVTLLKNARNPNGVLSSKATGEPALLMGISVLFAIKDALNSSRNNAGLAGWWRLDGPVTVEKIHQHAGVNPEQFIF